MNPIPLEAVLPSIVEQIEQPIKITEKVGDHLNHEEWMCMSLQYNLLSKFSEIKYVNEAMFYNFEDHDHHHHDHSDDSLKTGSLEHSIEEIEIEPDLFLKKKEELHKKKVIKEADSVYQLELYERLIESVLERILTDEDKQYKLDVEEIIEEQLYQCV